MKKNVLKKVSAGLLAAAIITGSFPANVFAEKGSYELDYIINNPYETVDWKNRHQY